MPMKSRGVGPEIGGVMLIIAGIAFLIERFTSLQGVWRWLPLFVVFLGARDFRAPAPGRARSILLLLFGIWLQISASGFLGFDFLNSWPLLIVLVGIGLMVDGIIDEVHSGDQLRQGE
jgi:hypothetical protein